MTGRMQHGTIHYTATEIQAMAGGGPGAGGVPVGAIFMWSGTLLTIPTGYQLCDGTNSTPDLRSKFVKGAAAAQNPGGTGGGTTYGHSNGAVTRGTAGVTVNNESSHTHSMPANTGAGTAHTHAKGTSAVTPTTHSSQGGHTHDNHTGTSSKLGSSSGTPWTAPTTHNNQGAHTHDNHGLTWGPADESSHTHPIGGSSGAGSAHSHGVTEPNAGAGHDHGFTQPSDHTGVEPSYYAVAFIMRLT